MWLPALMQREFSGKEHLRAGNNKKQGWIQRSNEHSKYIYHWCEVSSTLWIPQNCGWIRIYFVLESCDREEQNWKLRESKLKSELDWIYEREEQNWKLRESKLKSPTCIAFCITEPAYPCLQFVNTTSSWVLSLSLNVELKTYRYCKIYHPVIIPAAPSQHIYTHSRQFCLQFVNTTSS